MTRHAADGDFLMLLFAPEYGLRTAHYRFADLLAERGVETWVGNLQEALFLPDSTRTIRQMDAGPVAHMVDYACDSGRRVVLAGDSYAAVIALRGAHHWQRSGAAHCLAGAVLIAPYALGSIPALGEEPEYLPVISATNIPLLVYQTTGGALAGEFDALLEALRVHGSPVYSAMIPGVMSLFYEEPPNAAMEAAAEQVADLVSRSLQLLTAHELPDLPPAGLAPVADRSGLDTALRPYRGELAPPPIRLTDLEGRDFARDDYLGQVTLVNFWATWCPPCVEEIPSLNALQQSLAGEPFEIVSINYAEEEIAIRAFMERVPVDFTVLMDPEGAFTRRWNVISYPSTFVIDRGGRIRYGVNAAIHWNDPDVVARLRELARE